MSFAALTLTTLLSAASGDTVWVYGGEVRVEGARQTKPWVVGRVFDDLAPGDTLTERRLKFHEERVYSLGLFQRVALRPTGDPAHATLVATVSERFFFLPFVVFGSKARSLGEWADRPFRKSYYGLGLKHTNVRGRNEDLSARFAVGYDPFVALAYEIPYMGPRSDYGLSVSLSASRVTTTSRITQQSALGERIQDGWSVGGAVRRHIGGPYLTASVGLGLSRLAIRLDDSLAASHPGLVSDAGLTVSPDGIDLTPSVQLTADLNTRDLNAYPTAGSRFTAELIRYGLPNATGVELTRVAVDLRRYQPLTKRPNGKSGAFIGLRLAGVGTVGGRVPNYLHVNASPRGYIGAVSSEDVQGAALGLEGDNLLRVALSLNLPLIRTRYARLSRAPLGALRVVRYAAWLSVFADGATTWVNATNPAIARTAPDRIGLNHGRFYSGYGAGLHLIGPYDVVVRLDLARNDAGRTEFILGGGKAF